MDRLISDKLVRFTAQAVLVLILAGFIALCAWLGASVHLHRLGRLTNPQPAIDAFGFLAAPLQQTFSALIALFAAVVPVVLSSVCYTVDTSVTPPTAGNELNYTGHAAFLLTLLGLIVGAGTLFLFTIDKPALADLASSKENAAAIQGLINGLIAFHGAYFSQLLGLKPK